MATAEMTLGTTVIGPLVSGLPGSTAKSVLSLVAKHTSSEVKVSRQFVTTSKTAVSLSTVTKTVLLVSTEEGTSALPVRWSGTTGGTGVLLDVRRVSLLPSAASTAGAHWTTVSGTTIILSLWQL